MTAKLKETLNITAPDELYALLIGTHEDLSLADSLKLNAKLVLLLANHIGDLDIIRSAIDKAKGHD